MKFALIVSGILGAMALAAPQLVAIGYVFLIVPGLILTIAPTVFVYLAATSVIYANLPIPRGGQSLLISFGLALVASWCIMQPFRARENRKFQASLQPDVYFGEPLRLHGHVRLQMPHDRSDLDECDYLCAAILDLPNVRSVTVARKKGLSAFQLVPARKDSPPGRFPSSPGEIVRKLRAAHPNRHEELGTPEMVEASWALRLAGSQRLMVCQPVSEGEADWVVDLSRIRDEGQPKVQRVEIKDALGKVHFRKSSVEHFVPRAPFYFGFRLLLSSGTMVDSSFHVGRKWHHQGDRRALQDLEATLLSAMEMPSAVDRDTLATLRRAVERALDDPTASAARLELAKRWLSLFSYDAKPADYALIARIVGDARINDIVPALRKAYSGKKVPATMRIAYAERILMDHSSQKDRMFLARGLAGMPDDAFANPDPMHKAIWADFDLLREAAPFAERMADLGGDVATAELMRVLEYAVTLDHWAQRRHLVSAAREGLGRLGPEASEALPTLREWFLQRRSPITNNANDARAWRMTFCKMGVAVDDLPFYSTQSADSIERSKRRIREQLKREQSDTSKQKQRRRN